MHGTSPGKKFKMPELDRKSIDVELFVVKDGFGHLRPLECEYRYTEYDSEYDDILRHAELADDSC